jgi:hypothetical protein
MIIQLIIHDTYLCTSKVKHHNRRNWIPTSRPMINPSKRVRIHAHRYQRVPCFYATNSSDFIHLTLQSSGILFWVKGSTSQFHSASGERLNGCSQTFWPFCSNPLAQCIAVTYYFS